MSWQQKVMLWGMALSMSILGIAVGLGVANTPDHIRQQLGIDFMMLVASTVPTLIMMLVAALDNGGWNQIGKLFFAGTVSAYILGLWAGYVFLPLLQK